MAKDRALFDLDADGHHRLAYDDLQWIVQRKWTDRKTGEAKYRGISFVATEKRILLEVIGEKGVLLSAEARERIAAMPSTFKAWLAAPQPIPERREGILGVPVGISS